MSNIKIKPIIEHTPSFKEYQISGLNLSVELQNMGLEYPLGMLDWNYYHTDMEGWGKILYDLVFKSDLYKKDRFDCEDFALKAMVKCRERYGLNTLAMVIGDTPLGRHGFNMFYYGEGFMLFEPNEGFNYDGAFDMGEHGYRPDSILI